MQFDSVSKLLISLIFMLVCEIQMQSQCFIPVNQRITNIDTNSVSIEWVQFSADSFEIEIREISNSVNTSYYYISSARNINIFNLNSATAYDFRIRAFCTPGLISNWTSRIPFITVFDNNKNNCERGITIIDRNCGNNQYQNFKILVQGFENRKLGQDIDFLETRLIIEHNWPSDMKLLLSSPSGKTAILSKYRGIGRDHMGNPNIPLCKSPLIFTPLACTGIIETRDSLIGAVFPEENYEIFNDGSSPNGIWTLSICDTVETDIGILEYLQLRFSDNACVPALNVFVTGIDAQSVDIGFTATSTCDSFVFEIAEEGFLPGYNDQKGNVNNRLFIASCMVENIRIDGLEEGKEYNIYVRSLCAGNEFSDNTCGIPFQTVCGPTQLYSGFDDLTLCSGFCPDYCDLDGFWVNTNIDGLQWTVNANRTPTEETGPIGDVYQKGKYIYVEGSDSQCIQNGPAIIQSPCLQWAENENSGCDLSFYYHMFGASSGEISFEVSTNEGKDWNSIWSKKNFSDPNWQIVEINLDTLKDEILSLRFSGNPYGNFGDIALDEINIISNVSIIPKDNLYYIDKDIDGYGDPNEFIYSCLNNPPVGYVNNNLDCDDSNPFVNPSMEEIPCNGIDDNCSGQIDDTSDALNVEDIIITDESCLGANDGSIRIFLTGGLPPFDVRWNDGSVSLNRLNIGQGHYSATITDFNNCTIEVDSIFVYGNQVFAVEITNINPNSCPGMANGSIQLNAINGQAPYFYNWSDGYTGDFRENMTEGIYWITIIDNNNCQVVKSIEIIPSSKPQIQLLELRQPSCPDKADGLIRIRVSSGKMPFVYEWSHFDSLPTIRDLNPGIYHVTVTDADGCTNSTFFELIAPPPINIQVIAIDPVTCPGGKNGSIKIRSSGGTGQHMYNWNNGLSFNRDISGLFSGFYSITVTDTKNCKTSIDSVFIDQPSPFKLESIKMEDNKCLLTSSGEIIPEINGGTPPYLFFWSTGSNEAELKQLPSGNYLLTITDEQNCKHTFPPFIIKSANVPLGIVIDSIQHNLCFGDNIGHIKVKVFNAELPIQYHWTTGDIYLKTDSVDMVSNLSTGTYAVTVTDVVGCIGVLPLTTIIGPSMPLNYAIEIKNPITCFNEHNGKLEIQGSGGTPPYQYLWNNGSNTKSIDSLSPGFYFCELIDYNGCTLSTQLVELSSPNPIQLTLNINEEECSSQNGHIELEVVGGTQPYQYRWYYKDQVLTDRNIYNLDCSEIRLEVMDFFSCMRDTTIYFGVNSQLSEKPIKYQISPNPFSEFIQIETASLPLEMKLYNALGVQIQIHQMDASNEMRIIDTSMLKPGIYFLQIRGSTELIKLIKI